MVLFQENYFQNLNTWDLAQGMAQPVCQSKWVHVTRRWTPRARIQERELKLKSRIEVKEPKNLQNPPADTAAKGNGVGKTHSNFLYWWCCAKVDFFPSVICQGETHKLQFPASNYQSQAFDSPNFPILSLMLSEALALRLAVLPLQTEFTWHADIARTRGNPGRLLREFPSFPLGKWKAEREFLSFKVKLSCTEN